MNILKLQRMNRLRMLNMLLNRHIYILIKEDTGIRLFRCCKNLLLKLIKQMKRSNMQEKLKKKSKENTKMLIKARHKLNKKSMKR